MKARYFSFQKIRDEWHEIGSIQQSAIYNALKTVVCIVSLMLATMSLEAKADASRGITDFDLDVAGPNALISLQPQEDEVDWTWDYLLFLDHLKNKNELGYKYEKVEIPPSKVTNYKYTLLFVFDKKDSDKVAGLIMLPHNYEDSTYMILDNDIDPLEMPYAPKVCKLVYHDIGEDKEFCGVWVEQIKRTDNGKYFILGRELILPDDAAQMIIDLMANKSKKGWTNGTDIQFKAIKTEKTLTIESKVLN